MSDRIKSATMGMAWAALAFLVGCAPEKPATAVPATPAERTKPKRPLVILNEDNDHFMFGHIWSGKAQRGEPLTVAYIHEYLDKYLQPAVTHFFVNPNCNTVYYGSEVETRAWEMHREIGCPCKHAPVAEDMWRRGLDPYATMIARAREKGISPWLSMRMNDVHDATETNLCRTSRFWKRHPEFRRDPKAQARPGSGGWGRFCYDYAHPEVREHQLAVAVELMTRYDADGIEFDWMRWPVHLKPGDERKQAGCLTEFMRQARREADRIGRRKGRLLQVAVRVHSNPDEALDLGTDVFAWAREGLVDMVIPCNFLVMTDYQLPLRDWKRRMAAANPKVTVIPGTDSSVRPEASNWHDNVPISAAELRGFFDLMFREGAEGFYFFNHFNHGRKSDRGRFLSEPGLLDGERIARQSRAYPVSFLESTRDRTPEHTRVQFPLKLTAPARIRIAAGSPPPGDFVFVKLAFFEARPSKALLATVRLNGVAPVACGETDIGEWLGKHAASVAAVCLKFPSAAAKEGTNEVVLGGVPGEKAVASACELYEPVNGEVVK